MFGNLKSGTRADYHWVSSNWLRAYLNEYAWRYNRRAERKRIISDLLLRAAVVQD